MKIESNGKVEGKDMKEKVLVFSENEQKKYGLDERVTLKTDIWKKFGKAKNIYHMIYDDQNFEIRIKKYSPQEIKLQISYEDIQDAMSFRGDNQRQTTSRATYNLFKKTAIWYQTNNERSHDDEDNSDTENENSYKMMREQSLLDHDAKNIGDVLDNEDLKRDVKKMASFLGFPEIADEIDRIFFDGRLGNAAGQITFQYSHEDRSKIIAFPRMKVNPKLPDNDKGITEYFNTIKHELAHAITESGDGEKEFMDFCEARDIGQFHSINLAKYHIVCKDCGRTVRSYHRKGKVVKSVENQEGRYTCSECGGQLKLHQQY